MESEIWNIPPAVSGPAYPSFADTPIATGSASRTGKFRNWGNRLI
jgi:hypothetical protein